MLIIALCGGDSSITIDITYQKLWWTIPSNSNQQPHIVLIKSDNCLSCAFCSMADLIDHLRWMWAKKKTGIFMSYYSLLLLRGKISAKIKRLLLLFLLSVEENNPMNKTNTNICRIFQFIRLTINCINWIPSVWAKI